MLTGYLFICSAAGREWKRDRESVRFTLRWFSRHKPECLSVTGHQLCKGGEILNFRRAVVVFFNLEELHNAVASVFLKSRM